MAFNGVMTADTRCLCGSWASCFVYGFFVKFYILWTAILTRLLS